MVRALIAALLLALLAGCDGWALFCYRFADAWRRRRNTAAKSEAANITKPEFDSVGVAAGSRLRIRVLSFWMP